MLLDDLRRTVCDAAAGFDAGSLDASGAASAVSAWTAITNAAQAACALAAARAAACGTPDAPQWLASQTGTSAARAKEMIATGQRMRSETRERATAGALSFDQAAAISDAAALAP